MKQLVINLLLIGYSTVLVAQPKPVILIRAKPFVNQAGCNLVEAEKYEANGGQSARFLKYAQESARAI